MPNFICVALFVQKLLSWGNFTPPQLFNVHKKPNWERVNSKGNENCGYSFDSGSSEKYALFIVT